MAQADAQTSVAARSSSLAFDHDKLSEISDNPRDHGVTRRVVVLSLLLSVVFGYALPVIDYKFFNTFLGGTHLPPGAIGVLLLLILVVNPLLRVASKKWGLSRNEALTVYITCLFSSMVPGHGSENFTIPNLLAPFYFATPENKWLDILQGRLPYWMTPAITEAGGLNKPIYDNWFQGVAASFPYLVAWTLPLIFWISFTLISYVMLGCLSIMLRAQWAEHEALAFPLLRLPLDMTEDLDRDDKYAFLGRFFRNPLMWIGFAIAVVIQGQRGLNLYYPDIVPNFPLDINMGPLLSEPPWNQIGWLPVNVYFIVIGITYLLTSEVSFSLWFFLWFFNLQLIGAYYLGFTPHALPGSGVLPEKTFMGFQQAGAYFAYVAIVLWTARAHFKHVIRRAFKKEPPGPQEANEAMSYPAAFWGFVVTFALMILMCCMAGVRLDVAIALWLMYLVFAIGLTRVAVEGGMLALQHHALPLGVISKLINTGPSTWLTYESGVVPAAMFQSGFAFHMRCFIMPAYLYSLKLAHDRKIAMRKLCALVAVVIVISTVISWLTTVKIGYDSGALQFGHRWWAQDGPKSPIHFVETVLTKANNDPISTNWLWLGVGAVLTYGMMVARSRLLWFPFHPMGYLMGLTYPTKTFWTSIFIGWLCKVVITRYGGMDSYRKAIPLFLGLALGDVAMMLLWIAIDAWQGRSGHLLLPG
jgi:hypothetical protein